MKTLTADESMKILNCERTRFLELVTSGEIPGAKIGKKWVFLEEDIYIYLKKEIAKQQEFYAEKKRIMEKARKTQLTETELIKLRRRNFKR